MSSVLGKSAGLGLKPMATNQAVNRTIDHVHKLERKTSSGDLHSRLKTRKLLGVGETDDGDVHRSKLSQILGHSEQLYLRLPRGLRLWQFATTLIYFTSAFWAIVMPRSLYDYALSAQPEEGVILPLRLYGGALLALAVVSAGAVQTQDRQVVNCSLVASALNFSLHFIVTFLSLIQQGIFLSHFFRLLTPPLIAASISLYYCAGMSNKSTKLKVHKSPTVSEQRPLKDNAVKSSPLVSSSNHSKAE